MPADGASDSESDGELIPEAAALGGRCGATGIFTQPDGAKFAVALLEHYAYRDHLLSPCSFDEFIIAFRVDKLKAGELEEPNKPHPHAGRHRMTTYRLLFPHPLHDFHILRERAKCAVPMFTRDPPPRLPTATAAKGGTGKDRLREGPSSMDACLSPGALEVG